MAALCRALRPLRGPLAASLAKPLAQPLAQQRFFSDPAVPSTQPGPHFRTSLSTNHLGVEKVSRRDDELRLARDGRAEHQVEPRRLNVAKDGDVYKYDNQTWSLPMINRVWKPEEVSDRMARPHPQHVPATLSDRFVYHLVKHVLYRGFNWLSGYNYEDPTAKSCAYRMILLESVAGVPGMVAGVVRHLSSLRTLKRDHGWIHTLLEEAQNERMHLLVALRMFQAGLLTRISVLAGQMVMVPLLFTMYIFHPKMMHRLVGYLEECATETYTSLVEKTKQPGTKLNKAWSGVPASSIAKAYWNLPEDAEWVHVLEQILADETNHRDVNHTFADMDQDDPNPFVEKHIKDIETMWRRDLTGLRGSKGAMDK